MHVFHTSETLGKSALWQLQRDFYVRNGLAIWRERPALASSSAYIARGCTRVLAACLSDMLGSGKLDLSQPVYLVELGTGSACFTYRMMHMIADQMEQSPELAQIDLRFVFTDIVDGIVDVWMDNERLHPWIEQGRADCAIFDPAAESSLFLHNEKRVVNLIELVNPPIFLANSVYDTICTDAFNFVDGKVHNYEARVEIDSNDPMEALERNSLRVKQRLGAETTFPHYEEQVFDRILQLSALEAPGLVALPIGGMRIIENVRKHSPRGFALLVCSKGFADPAAISPLERLHYQDLSFPCNFDAIHRLLRCFSGAMRASSNGKEIERTIAFGFVPHAGETYPLAFTEVESLQQERYLASAAQLETEFARLPISPAEESVSDATSPLATGLARSPVSPAEEPVSDATSQLETGLARSPVSPAEEPVSDAASRLATGVAQSPVSLANDTVFDSFNQLETDFAESTDRSSTEPGFAAIERLCFGMEQLSYDPAAFLAFLQTHMDTLESEIEQAPDSVLEQLHRVLTEIDRNVFAFGRRLPEPFEPAADAPLSTQVQALLISTYRRCQTAQPLRPLASAPAASSRD